MAKEKSPFHQLLIDNGLTADVLKAVLEAHEAELKKFNDSKADELAKLNADHETAIKAANDSKADELAKLAADHETAIKAVNDSNADTISALQEKVAELSSKIEQTERITLGTYTAKDKKTYKFQDGILEFVFARSGSAAAATFVTKEALNDAALMEELISIGAGFIQEVEVES